MNETKEHFLKTTRQYFIDTSNNIAQVKDTILNIQPKKYYIKEKPFVNSDSVHYK